MAVQNTRLGSARWAHAACAIDTHRFQMENAIAIKLINNIENSFEIQIIEKESKPKKSSARALK